MFVRRSHIKSEKALLQGLRRGFACSQAMSLRGARYARFMAAIIIFGGIPCLAQMPDTLWSRVYSEFEDSLLSIKSITATTDTGFAISGCFHNTVGEFNGMVLKGDRFGNTGWHSTLSLPGSDELSDIVGTVDGGVFGTGYTQNGRDSSGILAYKYSASGDVEWSRILIQLPVTDYYALQTEQGDLVVAGMMQSSRIAWWPGLVRFSPTGDTVFVRNYPHPYWDGQTNVTGVIETINGGFIVTAYIDPFGAPFCEFAYLIRINSQGDTLWTRTLGYSTQDRSFMPSMTCRATDGNYLVAIQTWPLNNPNAISNLILLNLTDQGDTLWSRRLEFPPYRFYGYGRLAVDPNGGILVSATFRNAERTEFVAVLFKVDFDGNVLWSGMFRDSSSICVAQDIEVAVDSTYLWLLAYGDYDSPRILRLRADTGAGAPEPLIPPTVFVLHQNYPNPFNSLTSIHFVLPQPMNVRLTMYDVTGRAVTVLADEVMAAGSHDVIFDGDGLPSGVYFARLHSGEFSATRKLLLLR